MRPLVSSVAALAADRWAETEAGYPPVLLMEEAGIRLQDRLEALRSAGTLPSGPTVYLIGPGNNGGDALVMARQAWLRGRRNLAAVLVFPPSSASCRQQETWARTAGVPLVSWPSPEAEARLRSAALWVDGLFGTGLRGPLRDDRAAVLSGLKALRQETGIPSAAVDVPSGLWEGWLPPEPVLTARVTLAPGWPKDFCYHPEARPSAGLIEAVPVAFPRPAEASAGLWTSEDLPVLLPPVDAYAHKGRRGHVAVAGGSPGMTGALVLAGRSAAASGAGLVTLGTDSGEVALVAPQVPAFQTRPGTDLPGRADRYDAWVIGPGWGRGGDRPALLRDLLDTGLPAVLDADALTAWVAAGLPGPKAAAILTPHPGEFARLVPGEGLLVPRARSFARERAVTLVLKGAVTWVFAPDGRQAVWDGANAALGTGGSGDCLAGIAGALLAAGLPGFEAAVGAVALHGTSGRSLADAEGWFTADRLPEALARTASACRTAGPAV